LNNGIINWRCKRQATIATSSTEAELAAFELCRKHSLWLRGLLCELGIKIKTMQILGDNQSSIAITKAPEMRARTKHLNITYWAIRESVDRKLISFKYVPTDENYADALTKALTAPSMLKSIKTWGLSSLRGDVRG
jgi:hypothetical protein